MKFTEKQLRHILERGSLTERDLARELLRHVDENKSRTIATVGNAPLRCGHRPPPPHPYEKIPKEMPCPYPGCELGTSANDYRITEPSAVVHEITDGSTVSVWEPSVVVFVRKKVSISPKVAERAGIDPVFWVWERRA